MSRTRLTAAALVGGLPAVGLAIAAFLWGADGAEAASWIAGVGSFGLAVAAVLLALSEGRGKDTSANEPSDVRQHAVAEDRGRIYQAGRDMQGPPL
jgi:hypothetical protein